MTRFNQFLLILAFLFIASCARLVLAKCPTNNFKGLHELSDFTKRNVIYPGVEYHYNGKSVSLAEYEKLMLERKRFNKTDPNLRLP